MASTFELLKDALAGFAGKGPQAHGLLPREAQARHLRKLAANPLEQSYTAQPITPVLRLSSSSYVHAA